MITIHEILLQTTLKSWESLHSQTKQLVTTNTQTNSDLCISEETGDAKCLYKNGYLLVTPKTPGTKNHRKTTNRKRTGFKWQAATKFVTQEDINLRQKKRCHFSTKFNLLKFVRCRKKLNLLNENRFVPPPAKWLQDLKISRQTNIISDKISMNNSQSAKAHKSVLQPGIWASCS